MTYRPRQHHGFTAVELLAALALASLLMVAVLGVLGSIGRTRATLTRHGGPNPWLSDIEPVIRQDLLDARTLDVSGGAVHLQGYGALDPVNLVRTHRPADIRYLVRQAGACSLLIREQRTFDDRTGAKVLTQIVALDVASVALLDVQWPRQVHLVIQASVPGGPSVDRVLVLE